MNKTSHIHEIVYHSIFVSVAVPQDGETCQSGKAINLPAPDGYLSGNIIGNIGSSESVRCEWRLEAEPGQHVSITIFNFNPEVTTGNKYG